MSVPSADGPTLPGAGVHAVARLVTSSYDEPCLARNIPVNTRPSFACRPVRDNGTPVAREIRPFAFDRPDARFHENDRPGPNFMTLTVRGPCDRRKLRSGHQHNPYRVTARHRGRCTVVGMIIDAAGIDATDRGAVVTGSSIWLFDGHGRCRRSDRNDGGGVRHGPWLAFRAGELRRDADGSCRLWLRTVGTRRPGGETCGGTVCWANVPAGSALWAGTAAAWFAPSPVPDDRDLAPDELPFTAFGQFGPGALDLRVFDQDRYWVDHAGVGHRIDAMDDNYRGNVVAMLAARAEQFHAASLRRAHVHGAWALLHGEVSGDLLAEMLGTGTIDRCDAGTWLDATPLLRRLRRGGRST